MTMGAEALLYPLSPVYGAVLKLRAAAYARGFIKSYRAPLPVISVGNISLGGTGKTPMVAALARDLVGRGRSPAILSRGWGRESHESLVVRGPDCPYTPAEAGDEPVELASRLPGIPILVDADRTRSASRAPSLGADCLLLDDGFQHLRLRRDLDILLIDAGDPWAGRKLPPGGRLREPLDAVRRADVVIVTKINGGDIPLKIAAGIAEIHPGCPVLGARIRPLRLRGQEGVESVESLRGRDIFVVAGIGRPEGFLDTLRRCGARVADSFFFPDHHRWKPEDLAGIFAEADRRDLEVLTTAKDAVKMLPHPRLRVLEISVEPLEGNWDGLWELFPGLFG